MQVHFNPEANENDFSLAIGFRKSELNFALSVLKGIQSVLNTKFLAEAIQDLESYIAPKRLPMINYFHICQSCFREVDERDENTMCISKDGDTKWRHRNCPPLKKDRPR